MHALDWIREHGLYLRAISAAKLRKALSRKPKTCTWCGTKVPKGRSNWCGDACVQQFQSRCRPQTVTCEVWRRDRGVCAACGKKGSWQADHILPVCEGGGLCGLDNYRTMCVPCHKKVTAELAARRAAARRAKKKPRKKRG